MSNSAFTVSGTASLTGSVVQVIYNNGAGSATSSTTAVDITGSSTTITPTSASNKILVWATWYNDVGAIVAQATSGYFQCVRTSTIIGGTPYALVGALLSSGSCVTDSASGYIYVDNPATTSATTYKFQHYGSANAPTITTSNMNIVLMEIVA
ncbi:MAG: hypothetical protein KIH63_004710 [Candidatus Saccharibacteria bacterium]|nr:hypothetical protein [Candidatus Saccharibacteria bacterium]